MPRVKESPSLCTLIGQNQVLELENWISLSWLSSWRQAPFNHNIFYCQVHRHFFMPLKWCLLYFPVAIIYLFWWFSSWFVCLREIPPIPWCWAFRSGFSSSDAVGVLAHVGIEGNERTHALAKSAEYYPSCCAARILYLINQSCWRRLTDFNKDCR